jgi:hypothetical protein
VDVEFENTNAAEIFVSGCERPEILSGDIGAAVPRMRDPNTMEEPSGDQENLILSEMGPTIRVVRSGSMPPLK